MAHDKRYIHKGKTIETAIIIIGAILISFLGGLAGTYSNEKRLKKEMERTDKTVTYSMATKIANLTGLFILLLVTIGLAYFKKFEFYMILLIMIFSILTIYSTIACYKFKVVYNENELVIYSIFKKPITMKYSNINNYKFSEFKQQHILGTDCCGNIKLSIKLIGLINFWIEFKKHQNEMNEKLKAQLKFGNYED